VSQENVEAIRRGFQALRVGGVEALLPFFATDVVMRRGRDSNPRQRKTP
jgi:ketosteroid isomerase-like protein